MSASSTSPARSDHSLGSAALVQSPSARSVRPSPSLSQPSLHWGAVSDPPAQSGSRPSIEVVSVVVEPVLTAREPQRSRKVGKGSDLLAGGSHSSWGVARDRQQAAQRDGIQGISAARDLRALHGERRRRHDRRGAGGAVEAAGVALAHLRIEQIAVAGGGDELAPGLEIEPASVRRERQARMEGIARADDDGPRIADAAVEETQTARAQSSCTEPLPAASTTLIPCAVASEIASKVACCHSTGPQPVHCALQVFPQTHICCSIRMTSPGPSRTVASVIASATL